MRSQALQKGVVLSLAVVAIVFQTPTGQTAVQTGGQINPGREFRSQSSSVSSVEQRIERVENGLLAPTIVQGETPVRMKLADRMRFYKTPGVSIGVINDGKIEWARGFGVKEVDKPEPVNAETLFQSASISKSVVAMAALRLSRARQVGPRRRC